MVCTSGITPAMSTPLKSVLFVFLVCAPVLPRTSGAADALFFRSDRGIAAEGTGQLPEDLGAADTVRWRGPKDSGHSTPTVDKGKIFITTFRPAEQELATSALDAETGQLLWRQVAPATHLEQYHRGTGNPAAATPA